MQNNIQILKKYIAENTDKIERMAKEIEELKEKWLQPLQQLIEKINTNFSSYFAAMDCAGEVTLSHGENPVSVHMRCKCEIKKFFYCSHIIKYNFRWTSINMVLKSE